MPNYVRVMRRGSHNVRVLLENGDTQLVRVDDLPNWTCVGGNVQPNVTAPRSTRSSNRSFVNPENQSDRVYTRISRHGSRNTSVILPNGSIISVPTDVLNSTWLREGSVAYMNWLEETQYANGRTIDDITFGVELEFVANPNKYNDFVSAMKEALGNEKFSDPMCYNIHSTTKWLLKTDASVRNTRDGANLRGYELTSPILKLNQESKLELTKVLHIITSVFEGTINKTCGTHVHVGNFARIVHTDSFINKVRDFQRNYGYYEESVFDRLTSPSRRGNNNHYCGSCNQDYLRHDRYFKMNTCNIFGFGTLENRQHQGTLELRKIWAWAELNGRYMIEFFKDPSVFAYNPSVTNNLETFFDKIHLSEESKIFFFARESELN